MGPAENDRSSRGARRRPGRGESPGRSSAYAGLAPPGPAPDPPARLSPASPARLDPNPVHPVSKHPASLDQPSRLIAEARRKAR